MSGKDARIYYSQPVLGLLPWQSYFLAFVLGLFAVQYPGPACAALALLLIADRTLRGPSFKLPILVFICCAAFGFGYASQRTPELPTQIPDWMESRDPVVVDGVVESAEPRVGGNLRIILSSVQCAVDGRMQAIPGKVAWSWRHPQYAPEPGQTVRVKLRVVPVRSFGNPGGWDYGWFWQRQGVFWRAWINGKTQPQWGERPVSFLWSVKSRLREAVSKHVPETQGGAMVYALVTGDRSLLDRETLESSRAAGLSHTLALSGLHVGFVAAMGVALAYLVGWLYPPLLLSIPRPKLAVVFAAPLVLAYAWLGQPSASLVRAATMYGFWGCLLFQGRNRVLMDGLFFALVIIVFISPLSVFDLSLQMSAVAVGGIGLMYPRFQFLFNLGSRWWQRCLGWIGGLLAISLSANIALLPLISWYFGTFSPNVLLNLFWVPVLGFIVMPFGFIGMFFSSFSLTVPFGSMVLVWASVVMDWLLTMLHLVSGSGLTPVFSVLRPLWLEIIGSMLLLVTALTVWRSRNRMPLGLAGIGFVLLVMPHLTMMVFDSVDEVRLTMLDVGLGQSLVLSLPGGRRWLIDGGGGSKSFDVGEAVVAPALTYGRPPRLEGVFMSHPDSDHSHGLPFILSRFDVGSLYTNGMLPRGQTGKNMRGILESQSIEPFRLGAGSEVEFSDDTRLEVLHPGVDFTDSEANEHSLVMRLVHNGRPLALLPGDVEEDGIAAVLASGRDLNADVLILPHHGSKTSFSPSFYRAVSPEVSLCSNGYFNRYGFPNSQVVKTVATPVLTTSRHGQIFVVWDADENMSVRAFLP